MNVTRKTKAAMQVQLSKTGQRTAPQSGRFEEILTYHCEEGHRVDANSDGLVETERAVSGVHHCVQKLSENDELHVAQWLSNLHE